MILELITVFLYELLFMLILTLVIALIIDLFILKFNPIFEQFWEWLVEKISFPIELIANYSCLIIKRIIKGERK
jgi:hypothetical protein